MDNTYEQDTSGAMLAPETEDDNLLPEGWSEQDEFFDPDKWSGETETDSEKEEDSEKEVNTESEEASEESVNPAEETTPKSAEEETGNLTAELGKEEEEEEAPKIKFKARVNHQDEEREVTAVEVAKFYQKAQVTDKLQKRLAEIEPKFKKYEDQSLTLEKLKELTELLDFSDEKDMLEHAISNAIESKGKQKQAEVAKLVKSGVHKDEAEELVKRKFETKSDEKTEKKTKTSSTAKPKTRDLKAEMSELRSSHPELKGKQLPKTVVEAIVKGQKANAAYAQYELNLAKQEIEKAKKEAKILKQNAASAAKAPVKGVSGGGATGAKAKDPFEAGFDSDEW